MIAIVEKKSRLRQLGLWCKSPKWLVSKQTAADNAEIETLMGRAFGPARYNRSVWLLRSGPPIADLSLCCANPAPCWHRFVLGSSTGTAGCITVGAACRSARPARSRLWSKIVRRSNTSEEFRQMAIVVVSANQSITQNLVLCQLHLSISMARIR